MRMSRWTATGAGVGILFAVIALTDIRRHLPRTIAPPDVIDFYFCYWLILGFAPWHHSLPLFYALVIALNACTFALVFCVIAIIVRLFVRFTAALKFRGNQ